MSAKEDEEVQAAPQAELRAAPEAEPRTAQKAAPKAAPAPRQSTRQNMRVLQSRLQYFVMERDDDNVLTASNEMFELKTFAEAVNCRQSRNWLGAMKEELKSIEDNNT
jgi:hypothetical protein